MIGLSVIAAGWALLVVGAFLLWGVPSLMAGGAVMILVGALVDLDRLKEPHAKRVQ